MTTAARLAIVALLAALPATAAAQATLPDSQAVASAIARTLMTGIENYRDRDSITFSTGRPWIRAGIDTTSIDTTSAWFKMVLTELRSRVPVSVRGERPTHYLLRVQLSSVQPAGDSVYVRALFTKCERYRAMNFWMEPADFTIKRVNGQWEPGTLRPGGHADGTCAVSSED